MNTGIQTSLDKAVMRALVNYQNQAKSTLNMVNTVMQYKIRDAFVGIVNKVTDREGYLHVLGKTTGSVVLGQQSRTAALRQCLREFSEKGLPGFVDASGREWKPETYINMDIRTTVTNVAHESQFSFMDAYGCDFIEVSSHAAARPLCAPFQGRVFSRSGGSGIIKDGAGRDVRYEDWHSTSYGEPAGLLGINCGHFIYPFFPNSSFQTFAPTADAVRNDERYRESQKQRYLERRVREAKREAAMMDAAGDQEGFEQAALRVKQRQKALNDFCSVTDSAKRSDRVQVLGYDKSVAGKVAAATKTKHSDIQILRSVGAKARNFDVLDLKIGEFFHFAEGTRIQNVEVFAGKGTGVKFRKAEEYADRYGGKPADWQHVKGFGVIDFYSENRKAEVHWIQCKDVGKFDFFVKRWLK